MDILQKLIGLIQQYSAKSTILPQKGYFKALFGPNYEGCCVVSTKLAWPDPNRYNRRGLDNEFDDVGRPIQEDPCRRLFGYTSQVAPWPRWRSFPVRAGYLTCRNHWGPIKKFRLPGTQKTFFRERYPCIFKFSIFIVHSPFWNDEL